MTKIKEFIKPFAVVLIAAMTLMIVSGCAGSNIPAAPQVNSAQEAIESGYVDEVCELAQEDFENLGLDPEEDYAYWMSIKQMIDPEYNAFKNSLMMEDLDQLDSYKTTFDGIMNVIDEYDYVDKNRAKALTEKVEAIYEFSSPWCESEMAERMAELEAEMQAEQEAESQETTE